jgi:hypothetical protein
MIRYFKRSIYMLLGLLMAGQLFAQEKQYFVYIQNEKPQPFYVKYNGKVLSSSERGYIILSELPAGTMPITVGFPRNEAPEQQFRVKLGKNDQGYLLKQTDEKNFALYNLQTFSITKANTPEQEQPVAAAPETGNAGGLADTGAAPAAPVESANTDTTGQAMMAALKKDLDTTFAGKAEVSATPGRPANRFAETLDKVVHDDRPADISLETPAAATPAATAAAETVVDAGAAPVTAPKKNRRKRRERAPLTTEEQQLLKEVMAEEHKAAQADSLAAAAAPAAETPAAPAGAGAEPVLTDAAKELTGTETPAAATDVAMDAAAPVKEKKSRKAKKKRSSEPEFIEFMDDSTGQRSTVPATETAAAPPAAAATDAAPALTDASSVTLETPKSKRKKRKLEEMIDAEEHPNNIVTDSVDYDAPARREKKAKKNEGVKMINSDCENMLDDNGFHKLLRKFVTAKDNDGMLEAFQRYTRGYCLETSQIRKLTQLISSDEYRYRLLDMAYPKAYDSENFADLSSLLNDNYYQSRFKAMLHK